jgi:hypothetical protein
MESSSTSVIFTELVQWITQPSLGGKVHKHIELRGKGSNRGLFARSRIRQGETLVSIPAKLVLSGERFPKSYGINPVVRVSSWLRCVASYYDACRRSSNIFFEPYLNSLPTLYESSLLLWTDLEVSCYLAGTYLGDRILYDRANRVLPTRYEEAVRPYLNHLGLLSELDDKEQTEFLQACVCIATRGFHVSNSAHADSYDGPYLIPFMDLFNHDSNRKCTTLEYIHGCFQMKAERDVDADDELFHSYSHGVHLTSTQFLQTFGFIPETHMDEIDRGHLIYDHVSPAIFTQMDVIAACTIVVRSSFPDALRDYMISTNDLADDLSWSLNHDISLRDITFLPDTFEVSKSMPLSEQLMTAFCVLLFPSDVYDDFINSTPSLLSKDILEDYFLGKLVCQAIQVAVESKYLSYTQIELLDDTASHRENYDDKHLLRRVRVRTDLKRLHYGLTIRLEEKSCLMSLQEEIQCFSDDFLGGISLMTYADILEQEPQYKKARME